MAKGDFAGRYYSRIEMLHGFPQPDKQGNYTFMAYWYKTYIPGRPPGVYEWGQVFCRPDVPGPDEIDPGYRPDPNAHWTDRLLEVVDED